MADAIDDRRCIFLAHLWRAERTIAQHLRALRQESPPWSAIDVERAIPWVEKKLGVTFAPSQRAALGLALVNKVLVITGGPWGRQDHFGQFDPEDCGSQISIRGVVRPNLDEPPSDLPRAPDWPPRPFIGSSRRIPGAVASGGTRLTRWNASYWSLTRPRWLMFLLWPRG